MEELHERIVFAESASVGEPSVPDVNSEMVGAKTATQRPALVTSLLAITLTGGRPYSVQNCNENEATEGRHRLLALLMFSPLLA